MTTGDFPLHIADTARHLAEWERRKAAMVDFVAEFEDGRTITVGVDCALACCVLPEYKEPTAPRRARPELRITSCEATTTRSA